MNALMSITVFMIVIIAVILAYNVYQLVLLDAKSRNIENPNIWALFSIGGKGWGLLAFLIRRKDTTEMKSKEENKQYLQLKRRITFLFGLLISLVILFLVLSIKL